MFRRVCLVAVILADRSFDYLESNGFKSLIAFALKLCERRCAVLRLRMEEFVRQRCGRACRSVTPVRCHSRGRCGYFGFVVAGPPRSSAKTSTMHVSSTVFIRIQHKEWSDSFFSLAVHVSSVKRFGPTWLRHTNRFSTALRIICGLSTTFIRDFAQQLPVPVCNWCVNPCSYPWFVHAVRTVKFFTTSHPNFLSSSWR